MKKKRIIPSIAILMVLTAIMIALTGCTTSEKPAPTVKNVYIKEDDNSSDNNAETKMLVELEDKGETEIVILSVPNELFDKLGIEKKEKYTKATEEKVKAVLNVLAKEYNVNIKTFGYVKFVADIKDVAEIVIVLCSISAGIVSVIGAYNCYSQENRRIRARRR